MMRRRAAAAGVAEAIGCHTFRATGITAYLANGGALEHAQEMAAHESPRTTKLYDRTKERLAQDEVERIRLRPQVITVISAAPCEQPHDTLTMPEAERGIKGDEVV
jgi:hypothetical protein